MTLSEQIEKIKSDIADSQFKIMYGKTIKEAVEEIIANVVKSTNAQDSKP